MEVVRGDEAVMQMRMVKSPAEMDCMRYAAKITSKTFDYVIENIKPGIDGSRRFVGWHFQRCMRWVQRMKPIQCGYWRERVEKSGDKPGSA